MVEVQRKTEETDIKVKLEIYGSGEYKIDTGIGFFNHMLEAFAKHSHINLEVSCIGDIDIDDHHSVEDIGIVLGQAFAKEIYPVGSIERYGNSTVVMDEASISCDLDISNRPFLIFELPIDGKVGNFDVELVEEFFRAFAFNAKITLHLIFNRGKNRHHIIEASFKALAVAIRRALVQNSKNIMPTTKGML